MPGPSYPDMRAPLVTPLRWRPDLLDHLRARHGIRRVPRRTVAPRWRHRECRLVWTDHRPGERVGEALADYLAGADARAHGLFAQLLLENVAVVATRHVGVIRTLLDGGHFRYPARAWAEARPILALLCLVGGLLFTLAACAAGPVLLGVAAAWLAGGWLR